MSTTLHMMPNQTTLPGTPPEPRSNLRAVVSTGWLAEDGKFGSQDKRHLSGPMVSSIVFHGLLFAFLALAFTVVTKEVTKTESMEFKVAAFVPEEGRGGGGGGSPAPAPRKQVEIPQHQNPVTVPIAVPQPAPDPPPTLLAPIQTNTSNVLQATGTSSVSLATFGGGGAGGGIGPGRGNGVGPGTGGGFGDGAFAPGNGVTWPRDTYQEKPKYTPDGMRAKIQGIVELEIVVLANGTVGSVRVTKSLDRASGLDDAAIEAAKKWRFIPGTKDGVPVATKVPMQLEFRLH